MGIQAQAPKRKIKVSTYLNIILGVTLVVVVLFGWFYLNKKNPLPVIQNTLTPNTVPIPEYISTIYGKTGDGMKMVYNTYSDGERIYVADTGNYRVAVFDYDGNFLHDIGKPDPEKKDKQDEGVLRSPFGIVVVNNEIYVTDTMTRMVHVFSLEGKFLRYFAPKQILMPSSIYYKDDKFYIIDSLSQSVRVLDSSGKQLLGLGGRGGEEGKLNYPYGIYVDEENNIYVADSNNNRIQIFDETGKLQSVWKGAEEGTSGGYSIPRGIAVDSKGNFYTAELLSNDIVVTAPDGSVKTRFSYGEPEKEGVTDKMIAPTSVFVDQNQRLYVSEFGNSRVLVYQIRY